MNNTARGVVDSQVRTDEVYFKKEDQPAGNVIYFGRAANFNSLDSDSVWNIRQVSYVGGILITRFANSGAYNAKWSLRTTYFPAVAPGPDFPAQAVEIVEPEGKVLDDSAVISLGVTDLLTENVPVGKTWRLRYAEVVCRGYGRWSLLVDGIRVAGGATGPKPHDRVELPGYVAATAGQEVKVRYDYAHGPSGIDADAFVGLTEF